MAFEKPITIQEVIEKIHKKELLLPAIQREFVWEVAQIEKLFDSLMRGYPIGTFLFWFIDKINNQNFQFYEFIKDYHEATNYHNPKASVNKNEEIIATLDGQQRLTALYLGLKGTYAYKIKGKRWDNTSAFPKRKLYLNLLDKNEDSNLEFDFKFLTDDEAKERSASIYWFKVGDILSFNNEVDVMNYQIKNELTRMESDSAVFANNALFRLYAIIKKEPTIYFFIERGEKLEKVLNIFIRVNSGGTPLSYSDLLLSIATAQWDEKDAREEINRFVDEINTIGDGFDFNKDFVLKTCLVLSDFSDIAFKVDNFNKENMRLIEKHWDNISSSIRLSVSLVSSFGYSRDTISSNYALIPIAYYISKKEFDGDLVSSSKYQNDRELMRKFLIYVLLKRIFGGAPDVLLRQIRQAISGNTEAFPLNKIIERLKGTPKSINFDKDDIDSLLSSNYGSVYAFGVLSLLYPTLDFRNKFHMDHIYPKSLFTMKKLVKERYDRYKCEFYLGNFNTVPNLQLLEGLPNLEKAGKDFGSWFGTNYSNDSKRKEYMQKHYIPNVDYEFSNFEEFINQRKKLIVEKLYSILDMDYAIVDKGSMR